MPLFESSISVFSQHFPQFEQRMRSRLPSHVITKDSRVIVVLVARGRFELPSTGPKPATQGIPLTRLILACPLQSAELKRFSSTGLSAFPGYVHIHNCSLSIINLNVIYSQIGGKCNAVKRCFVHIVHVVSRSGALLIGLFPIINDPSRSFK
jgi:hypothetical protein